MRYGTDLLKYIRDYLKNTLIPFIPKWHIPHPSHLWIAKTSYANPTHVTLQEAENLLHVTWSETILCPVKIHKKTTQLLQKNTEQLPSISVEEYVARQQQIAEKCVIRWLDDEIGWVVALQKGQSLEPGFLTCYTGAIAQNNLQQCSSYNRREYFFSLHKTEKYDIGVDAKLFGNMGRLLPFLLEKEYLENFNFSPEIKDHIAVANCCFQLALLNGIKTPCVFIPEKITASDDKELLLGINYSLAYLFKMQHENKPFKFIHTETFSHIDLHFYSQKMITVQLEGLSYSFDIPRLRIMAAATFNGLNLSTQGYDAEKNEYYKIMVPDLAIYQAVLDAPLAESVTITPIIEKI